MTDNQQEMMKCFNGLALLFMLTISSGLYAEGSNYSSVYTSLTEKCKVVSMGERGDSTSECPGKGDYRIFIEVGDDRSWIVIKKGEDVVIDLQEAVMQNAVGNFPEVSGTVAEWRYKGKTPIAFIFRIAGTAEIYPDDDSPPIYKTRSKLIVVRLEADSACVIGTTTSNVKAREMADDSRKMCR